MENGKKPCDCKGKRTCLLCEDLFNKKATDWYALFKVKLVGFVMSTILF